MATKKCAVCGKEKQLSEMSKSYPTRCKECVAEYTRLVRQRVKNQQEETLAPAEPHIDWEQRRYEIAKAIYPEIIKATHPRDAERVGNTTVLFADVLIKALKGEPEQEKMGKM
ncbi:MAG: hypothetical protein IKU16_06235 [Muribaculaceae bacterium]|nr:hypothetical protein [Muribaculaceae bacterium]